MMWIRIPLGALMTRNQRNIKERIPHEKENNLDHSKGRSSKIRKFKNKYIRKWRY